MKWAKSGKSVLDIMLETKFGRILRLNYVKQYDLT